MAPIRREKIPRRPKLLIDGGMKTVAIALQQIHF